MTVPELLRDLRLTRRLLASWRRRPLQSCDWHGCHQRPAAVYAGPRLCAHHLLEAVRQDAPPGPRRGRPELRAVT